MPYAPTFYLGPGALSWPSSLAGVPGDGTSGMGAEGAGAVLDGVLGVAGIAAPGAGAAGRGASSVLPGTTGPFL